jgi:hypothetical protein
LTQERQKAEMAPECSLSLGNTSWLLGSHETVCLDVLIDEMSKVIRNKLSPRDMLVFSRHESALKG